MKTREAELNQAIRVQVRAKLDGYRADYLAAKTDAEAADIVAKIQASGGYQLKRGRPSQVLVGQTFGRLSVVCEGGGNHRGAALWCCRCACGTRKVVAAQDLQRGSTESCGCLRRELWAAKSSARKPAVRVAPVIVVKPYAAPKPPPRPVPVPTDRRAMLLHLGRSMRAGRDRASWDEVAADCGQEIADELRAEAMTERGVA